jgi:eukaryotic-like serine/threonine-protein kinase
MGDGAVVVAAGDEPGKAKLFESALKEMAAPREDRHHPAMTPERWQQVKQILAEALELDFSARLRYLEHVCAGDRPLQTEVENLLALDQGTDEGVLVRLPIEELGGSNSWIGRRIGPYQIVEEIGQGGMGEVYRAFRADDEYRKQVAIKLVRAGQSSRYLIGRFKTERQVLASLDHPNIARFLDGGTIEDGTPYFVMELIEGEQLLYYCGHHLLSTTQRLELFLQVCSAVQSAHQRLIIHRDLKPGNVLVTKEGTPKLLDFGIAKLLDPSVPSGTHDATMSAFRLLTPAYASPEQIKGQSITTTSDLYSLGVLLYELLTGHHPYPVEGLATHQIAQAICEQEPERPSLAALRSATARPSGAVGCSENNAGPALTMDVSSRKKLSQRLRGDLDTILLMALRKDPLRRYQSVEQFAGDIRRHLQSIPVIARKDTFGYRASRFVLRHRPSVSAACAVLIVLLAAITFTLRQARIARRQGEIAERRFNDVRELANSLMFDVHDSIQDLPGSTPARKLIVDRALHYLDRLAQDSSSDPSLQRELATAFEKVGTVQGNPFGANLGDTQGALESYRRAFAIRQSLSQRDPGNVDSMIDMARAERLIAAVLGNRGDASAVVRLRNAISTAEQASKIAPSNPKVLKELEDSYHLLAVLLDAKGDYRTEAGYLEKELPIIEARSEASPDDRLLRRELGRAEVKSGYALARMGSIAEGLRRSNHGTLLLEFLAAGSNDAESTRQAGMAHWMVGDILLLDGDAAGALRHYQRQQQDVEPLATADPKNAVLQYDLACARARVGNAQALVGRPQPGFAQFSQAIQMFEGQIARDPDYVEPRFCLAATYLWMGEAFSREGRWKQSLQSYRRGLQWWEPLTLNNGGTGIAADAGSIHARLGLMLAKTGKPEEALKEFARALEIVEPIATASPDILEAQYALADIYAGRAEVAREEIRSSADTAQEQMSRWSEARSWYIRSLESWKRIEHAGARTPVGFACGSSQNVAREIKECDAALKRMSTR